VVEAVAVSQFILLATLQTEGGAALIQTQQPQAQELLIPEAGVVVLDLSRDNQIQVREALAALV
jgi:hypothetical protein